MSQIAKTTEPPYYAVIFTSLLADNESEEYSDMAEKMLALATKQAGFLGVESVREGLGITISYWSDLDAIAAWKQQADHQIAQQKGQDFWYQQYKVRIAKVESDYSFSNF
ncbi:MAG: antibiotic biosynthesis monooxygenase [Gammaproteobacteria bacterium]|nr:antibiotic biosynthesis monooxygenase [Gammaproteobacteria bacterium]